jgi:hypothetical protein
MNATKFAGQGCVMTTTAPGIVDDAPGARVDTTVYDGRKR